MGYPVTLNGRTYTLADFSGQAYAAGFPDALEDFVTDAGAKQTAAAASATAAATSATAAAASATAAAASVDAIEGFFLGAASSNPTVDLNGNALTAGDFYFNTTSNQTRIYDGSNWNVVAPDLVGDASPQLGGDLDVNGNSIVSTSNGNIAITPNGSGKIVLDGLSFPTSDGTAGQVLKTDGAGQLSFVTSSSDLVNDTSPQLGGNLDFNGNTATSFTSTGIDDNASSTSITIDSSQNVGINEASPDRFLHVNSGSETTSAKFESTGSSVFVQLTDDTNSAYVGADAGALLFQTPGSSFSTKLQISSAGDATFSGDVTAGGTATGGITAYAINYAGDDILNVFGSLRSSANTVLTYGAKPSTTVNGGYVSAADNFSFSKAALEIGGGTLEFKKSASGTDTVGNALTMTNVFSINTSGDTTFTGSVTFEGPDGGGVLRSWPGSSTYAMFGTANMTSSEYALLSDGTNTFIAGGTGGYTEIRYANNQTDQRITVASSGITFQGNIIGAGISSTLSNIAASGDIYVGVNSEAYLRFQGSTGVKYARFYLESDEDVRFVEGGNAHFNGNVIAYSTTIASDERFKDNVKPLEGCLDKVCQMRGVSYVWNEQSQKEGVSDIGVIAQEMAQIYPEVVSEVDGLNGRDPHLTVDYARLTAVLINAVKELREEVEELKHGAPA